MSATPPPWARTLFDALNRCTPKQADKHRAVLPYCAQMMSALPERAVLLNRDYKPLGVEYSFAHVRYEDHPDAHISVELYRLLHPMYTSYYFFGGTGDGPWESKAHLHKYREKIKQLVSPWIEPCEWNE
jgi:hypothetical protein